MHTVVRSRVNDSSEGIVFDGLTSTAKHLVPMLLHSTFNGSWDDSIVHSDPTRSGLPVPKSGLIGLANLAQMSLV